MATEVVQHGTGANSEVVEQIDPTHQAGRVSLRPWEWQDQNGFLGGHYRIGLKTGACTVIAAGGHIFSTRWAEASSTMAVSNIWVGFNITTAFTTAQVIDLDIQVIRAMGSPDSAGTAIVLGASNKKRSIMSNSRVADMRIATTLSLTAGSGNIGDVNAIALASCTPPANAIGSASVLVPLLTTMPGEESPLQLGVNEGFRIRLATTMGAAGVGNFSVVMDWAEQPTLGL